MVQAKPERGAEVVRLTDSLQWGTDELNFCEFPLAVLSRETPSDLKTIVREDWKRSPKTGRLERRRYVITAGDAWGLPTAWDDEVLLALVHLTKEVNNFTDRKVQFHALWLYRLLGWDAHGRSYDRLRLALRRWKALTISSDAAWWDKGSQVERSKDFGILEEVDFYQRRNRGAGGAQLEFAFSSIIWSDFVFKSFRDEYTKPIDMELFRKLQTPVAKRAFRFLDKRFLYRPHWEFDLRSFCEQKIGLQPYRFESKFKEKIAPGLAELEEHGVIRVEARFGEITRGKHRVVFTKGNYDEERKGPRVQVLMPEREELVELKDPEIVLIEAELRKRGISGNQAAELLKLRDAREIEAAIEEHDKKLEEGKLKKNSAGWLFVRVKDGKAPDGYQTKAERTKREAEKKERERRAKREEEERRKASEEQAARRRRDVDSVVATLAEEGSLEEFLMRAVESADNTFIRQALEVGLRDAERRSSPLWYLGLGSFMERSGILAPEPTADGVVAPEPGTQPANAGEGSTSQNEASSARA